MTQHAKILGRLFLKLELRSKDGSRRKFFMLLISYLLPGLLLPFLMLKQNTDTTGFEFAFLTFLFYSMILAITSVMEMDNLIVSKQEIDTLSCFPLRDELIVNAKLYVIRRYIFIIALPLLVPGAFYYFILLKSITNTILYLTSGILLTLFILTLLLLLYSFAVRNLKTKRINNYTLFFQLILIFAMIFSYQYISYSLSNRSRTDVGALFSVLESKNLLDFFPQSWFAFIPAKSNYTLNYKFILKIILPFFIAYMSYLSLKLYLTDNYSRIYEKLILSRSVNSESLTSSKNSTNLMNLFISRFSGLYLNNNPQEQSSFALMRYMLGRDKAVRLSILPMIIIPVGLALFALLTDQLPSPFVQFYLVSRPVFHISILVTVFIVLNTAILGLKVTNDPDAVWIYDAYPLDTKKNFINGIRKFFFIYLILPICLLLFIIFFLKMSFYDALLHTLFILASADLLNTIYHIFNKNLPLTKTNTLLNSMQRIASLIFPFTYGILFAVIQYFVYQNKLYTLLVIIFLILFNYLLVTFSLKTASS